MPQRISSLLTADSLTKRYPVTKGGLLRRPVAWVSAVTDVSLHIDAGETLGLLGESGCGKSTLARLLMALIPADQGTIAVHGQTIHPYAGNTFNEFRRRVQMVFQDPFASLNPRLTVGAIVGEPLHIHKVGTRAERIDRCCEVLQQVGLESNYLDRYPHEFSGGQRQRIAIARALALRPELIIADEAVSALDVSVQSQILNLLAQLQRDSGVAYLFISHDLAVVDHLADRVMVMYLGRIVEQAPRDVLFSAPAHPYSEALIAAVPNVKIGGKRRSGVEIGDVPSALQPPTGCAYHPRCPRAQSICTQELPILKTAPGANNHLVACHFPQVVA